MVKSRISILVSSVFMDLGSNLQCVADHGKNAIRGNDSCNACHHGSGCGFTNRRSAVARLHTPEAAGVGHQESKERALANAEKEAFELNGVEGASEILGGRDIQHADRHEKSAGYADEVRKSAQKRHYQDEGHHSWKNEEFDGRDAERLQGTDLLVDLHCSELGGECRARPTAQDYAGHEATHLTHGGDAHQVGDINGGAESH